MSGAYPTLPAEGGQSPTPVKEPLQPEQVNINMPPQPPPGQQPGQPYAAAPVVVQGGVVTWTEAPMSMDCPHCQVSIVTETEQRSGIWPWAGCGIMFGLGVITAGLLAPLWLCCWVPFCISAFKDTYHKCPQCHRELGKRGAFGLKI